MKTRMSWLTRMAAWVAVVGCCGAPLMAQQAAAGPEKSGVFNVAEFAKTEGISYRGAFNAAVDAATKAGGGIVVIPASAPQDFVASQIDQALVGEKGSTGKVGPGITIVDLRNGGSVVVPSFTGLTLQRQLKLAFGQSLPHWGYYPMLDLQNTVLRGSTSYREMLLEDVKAGTDRKFYLTTVRGIFPGMFINSNEWGDVQRLHVKSVGYDTEKNLWYFVADTNADIPAKSYMSNKNHVNALVMRSVSHDSSRSTELLIDRENYSQGDNYLLDARFKYMGDIHSTGGDENGVIFAAFIESLTDIFRGSVAGWDAQTRTLHISGKGDTLGNDRPIINMNINKWVTNGKALIVRPPSWTRTDAVGDATSKYKGKSYPSTRMKIESKMAGNSEGPLQIGGCILLTHDAPVTKEHIGWFFAVDVASEWLPVEKNKTQTRVRRWYPIVDVTENPAPDPFTPATKTITILRNHDGTRPAGAPTLYVDDNYTWDGHERPLSYVIAPGAMALDVADAVGGGGRIQMGPSPVERTASDFQKGDQIEQAIGADPVRPIPFQAHLNESIPTSYPFPVFDIINGGSVGRATVLSVRGGEGADRKPAFNTFIQFDSPANTGIFFNGANPGGSIVMNQNQRESPIVFRYGEASARKEAKISVSPENGLMKLESTGVQLTGPLLSLGGLSGTATPAANLRGINVTVPKGATELQIKFAKPEADNKYAAFVELNWLTARAIVDLKPEGFTVKFDAPAENGATLSWLIVR